MVREIVTDVDKLSEPCETTDHKSIEVKELIKDLMDTASFYADKKGCVGIASNQIGSNLRVILCLLKKPDGTPIWTPMINPVIARHSRNKISFNEGCLSVEGTKAVKRYEEIDVIYTSTLGNAVRTKLSGLQSAIVQHEIDHLDGKLI